MPMTCTSLRTLMKADPCCRAPEAGHAVLVYKARLAAALAKAPPNASLFGERIPSRHYKMKEMSPSVPTTLPRMVALASMDQDHGKWGAHVGVAPVAMWCPFPPRMSGKESRSDYIRGVPASVEGTANSSSSLPSLNPSTSSHLVLYPSQCNPSDKQE